MEGPDLELRLRVSGRAGGRAYARLAGRIGKVANRTHDQHVYISGRRSVASHKESRAQHAASFLGPSFASRCMGAGAPGQDAVCRIEDSRLRQSRNCPSRCQLTTLVNQLRPHNPFDLLRKSARSSARRSLSPYQRSKMTSSKCGIGLQSRTVHSTSHSRCKQNPCGLDRAAPYALSGRGCRALRQQVQGLPPDIADQVARREAHVEGPGTSNYLVEDAVV